MEKYTMTLHIGRLTKTGFATRFKLTATVKGDEPYEIIDGMMGLLDEKVIEKTDLQLILDINGVFIPSDFDDKGYTIEEAYHHAMETDVGLFLDMLKDALTGEHSND